MLIDCRYTIIVCIQRIVEMHLFAVEQHLTLVGLMNAGYHLDKG